MWRREERPALGEFKSDGVVRRKIKPSSPRQVSYSLSKAGDDLVPLMVDPQPLRHAPSWRSAQSGDDQKSQVDRKVSRQAVRRLAKAGRYQGAIVFIGMASPEKVTDEPDAHIPEEQIDQEIAGHCQARH